MKDAITGIIIVTLGVAFGMTLWSFVFDQLMVM